METRVGPMLAFVLAQVDILTQLWKPVFIGTWHWLPYDPSSICFSNNARLVPTTVAGPHSQQTSQPLWTLKRRSAKHPATCTEFFAPCTLPGRQRDAANARPQAADAIEAVALLMPLLWCSTAAIGNKLFLLAWHLTMDLDGLDDDAGLHPGRLCVARGTIIFFSIKYYL